MLNEIKKSIKYILSRAIDSKNSSEAIEEQSVIDEFISNSNNTFLLSFPRTGSHWLRMLMELYFGRPSLVRVFYYPERNDYLTLHTHDLELDVEHTNVIYLYRDPVDTIYSQLQYHKEDIDDREKTAYWSNLYGRHLDKWLHKEMFTQRKTIIQYERLKTNMLEEFNKICMHFDSSLDAKKLEAASVAVSKEEVKKKTPHDLNAINLNEVYNENRNQFRSTYGDFIWEVLLNSREHLKGDF